MNQRYKTPPNQVEHHGDCRPDATLRIETDELEAFHYSCMQDTTIADPFGNRLTFTNTIST
ncbi:hypothetical protein [Billgrantia montanilacus]|uniref:hypothetical protein n=1 Tax=Billgrantia montanilacus TaxID=2282305 RepID=UPI001C6A5419|nr:hypothetical protein [Halomonas montanilacus]